MKKTLSVFVIILCISLILPGGVSAVEHGGGGRQIGACYSNVVSVFWGWSACYDLYNDHKIASYTLVMLDNLQGLADKVWDDTVTMESKTSWTGTLGTEIAPNISLSVGVEGIGTISGGLAEKLQTTFAYQYARTIVRSQTLHVTAPPRSRVKEVANLYGRKYVSYAKHFIAWIESARKDGNVYTPEYYEYVTVTY